MREDIIGRVEQVLDEDGNKVIVNMTFPCYKHSEEYMIEGFCLCHYEYFQYICLMSYMNIEDSKKAAELI